jgi:NAD(P)-dependent dehydrogenase (short-subunit alcohol dehydrogenase family)
MWDALTSRQCGNDRNSPRSRFVKAAKYMRDNWSLTMPDLTGRIALITGASRGLGAAVAKRFAAEGAHVVLTARTVGGLEEVDDAIRSAGGEPATLVPLDLTELDQINVLGASLYQRFGRLDVVVANAAILGALGPVAQSDAKLWQRVMDVNLTANYRLIRSLDPLLRASDAGRAIFVTCAAGQAPKAFWSAYAVSKAGLESLAHLYAAETATSAIRVNCVDPGPMRTGLRATAYPGEDPAMHPLPEAPAGGFVPLAAAGCTATGKRIALSAAGD